MAVFRARSRPLTRAMLLAAGAPMKYRLCLALILMAFWLPAACPADEAGDADQSAGTALGSSTKEESAAGLRPGTPVPVTLTDLALADTRGILSEDNSCSAFFGGARKAVTVLDALAERIDFKGLPDRRLGISMTGGDGLFVSQRTGYQYRLFKQVIINTNGPFYRSDKGAAPPAPVRKLWAQHEGGACPDAPARVGPPG